jgi:hypothetical protein
MFVGGVNVYIRGMNSFLSWLAGGYTIKSSRAKLSIDDITKELMNGTWLTSITRVIGISPTSV